MTNALPGIMLCFFLLMPGLSSGQLVTKTYSSSVMKAFVKGQTFAVLTEDENFNTWFRATLDKQWTVSPVQFITITQLDSQVISDKNFFIYTQAKDEKTGLFRLVTSDDLTKNKEYFFVCAQGGYKQAKLLFSAGTSGSKILGSFRYGPDRAALTAGIIENEIMIALLNQSLQTIIEQKIRTEIKDSLKWAMSDENVKLLRDKTLLINYAYTDGSILVEDEVLIAEKALFDYPYEYLVIAKDSVQILFDASSGEYAYLFFYFPTAKIKLEEDCGDIIIYDPFLKKVLYYEDNMNGPWLEKWKIKQLVSAIKRK